VLETGILWKETLFLKMKAEPSFETLISNNLHGIKEVRPSNTTKYRSVYCCIHVSVFVKSYHQVMKRYKKERQSKYVGYSESNYSLRISLAHPGDCQFAHVQ